MPLESDSNRAATRVTTSNLHVLGVTAPPRNDSDKLLLASTKCGPPGIPLVRDSRVLRPRPVVWSNPGVGVPEREGAVVVGWGSALEIGSRPDPAPLSGLPGGQPS